MTKTKNEPTPESAPTATNAGFAALGLIPEILKTLASLGYEEPTPIQREAIPALLEGRDLLGQAATGTGKTAAFALPIVQKHSGGRPTPRRPRALVLVPTRELAMQVAEAIHKYGREKNATVLPIYGGQSIVQQLRVLERGVDVVVATPGRACDHLDRGTLDLSGVEFLVLDEADEMLDMGFAEDLEKILNHTAEKRQTALFSATIPSRIVAIASRHLNNPLRVSIAKEKSKAGTVAKVTQLAYVVPRSQKLSALGRILDMQGAASTIVFCRTRIEVDELTEAMNAHGFQAEAIHGGFSQDQRDRVLKRFRAGKADLLIATDVAARGLDIEHITHVVNFDVPSEPEAYVHRIGRTGRAGREGVAITIAEPRERRHIQNIEHFTQQKITFATIPTVADLRNRRIELTRASIREAVIAGELDAFRTVVESLASEFDPLDIAAAAVKLVHSSSGAERSAAEEEKDIASIDFQGYGGDSRGGRRERGSFEERPFRNDFKKSGFKKSGRQERGGSAADMTKIYIGAGRSDLVRPGDLVGAIANEAGLSGAAIGAIEIADKFSIVEVPSDDVDSVIRALRKTTIRGRKVNVRLDRDA
ncbi:MAG: DEAD/DEAH box helicase [Planctomycetes bacterium]|nr:DEAD/DEAH box helicase [Planctomycetota bacterium]